MSEIDKDSPDSRDTKSESQEGNLPVEQKDELSDEQKRQAAVERALQDPVKKRKPEDEIEIDMSSSVPLSKKQKRLLRRGKITLEELNAKYNISPSSVSEFQREQQAKAQNKENGKAETQSPEQQKTQEKFGVWIGNLSFDTTKEDIIRFIVAKTKTNEAEVERVTEADILRFKMPLAQNDGKKIRNKGFCYIDLSTSAKMQAIINLSEEHLNGRNLLIKNANDFKGRPDGDDLVANSKNPPSRILFVGNLPFDTTEDLLRKHFQHCGEIVKIRMATFEDTGKCKGFAFIDFKDVSGATNALTDKSCRKLALRQIRMEYGEDRSKRRPVRKASADRREKRAASFDLPASATPTATAAAAAAATIAKEKNEKKARAASRDVPGSGRKGDKPQQRRVKSSVALATAQRASAAIVPSQGKKIKFD